MRAWLAAYPWDFVTAQNAVLCGQKGALHKPTSDGHEPAKQLWGGEHRREMPIESAADLCRRCHRLAPFCFYNGNTFAAIMRDAVLSLNLPPDKAFVVRSLAGHIVAGVATDEEIVAFKRFSDSLE